MANYKVIGGDLKQYGPVSAEDLRKWIVEGRLNAQSLVQLYGDIEWKQLSTLPEFADAFAGKPMTLSASLSVAPPTNWLEREYELDIGGCISRGWDLFKNNSGLLFAGTLLYLLIEGAFTVFAQIPFVGPLFSIVNLIITGPLMGGVFYLFLQAIRGQPASAGNVFAGFRLAFGQLFLGYLVPALLAGLCLIPGFIVLLVKLMPVVGHLNPTMPDSAQIQNLIPVVKGAVITCLPVLLICLIPMIYLQISWLFTLPLIIDKRMGFWSAMKASWKQVNKHWWQVFGVAVLVGLINMGGLLLCCVGILFTLPIGLGALMYAYETIFAQAETQGG
ncbi:MAG TPA: glycerophosphoryl diester phosphodiesterase membrane domain-containing protein [Candidatus Sulfopaludibacter sp.]|nr:glycerophosphoryl diester phosphodiesterase membrane domain-containing protein [Candidatus Sulfopaludibacter sp.]